MLKSYVVFFIQVVPNAVNGISQLHGEHAGIGMELQIRRKIAERYGGSITARSKLCKRLNI